MIGPTPNFADLEFQDPAVSPERVYLSPEEAERLPKPEMLSAWCEGAMVKHKLMRGRGSLVGYSLVFPGPAGKMMELNRSKLYTLVETDEFSVRRAVEATIAKIAEYGPGVVWFLGDPVHFIAERSEGVRARVRPGERPLVILVSYYGHEKQAKEKV